MIRGTNALLTLQMCRKVLRKVDRRDRDAADETLRAVVERVSEQLNHQLVRPSKRIDYANLAAATVPPPHHPCVGWCSALAHGAGDVTETAGVRHHSQHAPPGTAHCRSREQATVHLHPELSRGHHNGVRLRSCHAHTAQ